ncbi:MAG TPA: MarR family transcriptional regulator [Gammaproteobacteria bacterium]|nr:MarR family transcriptional regulator [Gammaproteobacteria bacterium]
MKKSKSKRTANILKVKTGSVKEFFSGAREIMRAADRGEIIKKRCATLTFVDPTEMLHFLSAAKIKLIASIRKHPDSITNIAKAIHRTRSAVKRDIHEMESVGIVKTHEEVNPAGHGRHKIVELVAPTLKLEAYI